MTTTASQADVLEIFESALPSALVSSIESVFSSETEILLGTTARTSTTTGFPRSSTQPTETRGPTSLPVPNSHSFPLTSSSFTTSAKQSTLANIASSASSPPTSSATDGPKTAELATSAPPPKLKNAAVAGIASGLAAGAVLALLLALFLLRRRQQGKSPFGPRPPKGSGGEKIFPEVAWLYDPARTPTQRSRSERRGSEAAASLIPKPPRGTAETEHSGASPPLGRGAGDGASSPLLTPGTPGERSHSPHDGPGAGDGASSPLLTPAMPEARSSSPVNGTGAGDGASSPLLTPVIPAAQSHSPHGDSSSRGDSPARISRGPSPSPARVRGTSLSAADHWRPMTAIFEEQAGASGTLLRLPDPDAVRHST